MMRSLLTIPKSALCLIQIKASLKATTEDVTFIAQLCCFSDIRFHIQLLGRNDIASASSRKFSSFKSDLSFRGKRHMSEYSAEIKSTSNPFHIETTSFPISKRVSRFQWQGIPKFLQQRGCLSTLTKFFVLSNQLILCESRWS